MYRGIKYKLRQFFELCVYTLTCVLSLYVVFGLQIPEQASVKELTKRISPYYPNCLDDSNVIVLVPPYPEVLHKIIAFYLIYLLVMTLATIITAQLAYFLLSRRMSNQSEKTKMMHRKFNRRTLFQVLIDTSFTSIPFTISNLATLFQWRVPELTYVVDVLSRNNPTACIIVIFVYYEPYQKFLKELVQTSILKKYKTTAVNSVKSVDVLM
ncbi:hypothetical protein CAEBREN_29485 [Caenorhabditis brenneri]|uniref:G-protein coupled receptors family 1 profile domain-containing protein n=1 Tax=Caenorhabditis brenneri TaxID=135651 RepID=G0N0R6_CAEBE|nr:hypothetical protein CAEBREN_29485 [Caenorhabditis brenneri]